VLRILLDVSTTASDLLARVPRLLPASFNCRSASLGKRGYQECDCRLSRREREGADRWSGAKVCHRWDGVPERFRWVMRTQIEALGPQNERD